MNSKTVMYSRFRVSFILSFFLLVFLTVPATKSAAQYDDDYISHDDFYQSLAPYGQWVEDPQYGYVWSPDVDADFRPYYTSGHWVMTEYGNTWVSEYPWGWAAFHYGRWTYDDYYGWLWIPGNYWGPAWVSWRSGDGFYGWAPLGPDYRGGNAAMDYNCPGDWWVFIPPQYIYSDHYYQYWNGPRGNTRIINNTVIINNTFENGNVTYYTGPHVAQVRQVTGKPVQVFKVRNSRNLNTRVHNDVVRMYRPAEIRPASRVSSQQTVPPNVVVAPRAVRQPQPVSANPGPRPPFRANVAEQRNSQAQTPGTNISQIAEPQRQTKRSDNNPYEYDVSRPVRQDPQPARQTRTDPQPAPVRQTGRRQPAAPAPVQPAPAPTRAVRETQPTPTPAQQPVRESQPAPSPAPAQPGQRPGGRR